MDLKLQTLAVIGNGIIGRERHHSDLDELSLPLGRNRFLRHDAAFLNLSEYHHVIPSSASLFFSMCQFATPISRRQLRTALALTTWVGEGS